MRYKLNCNLCSKEFMVYKSGLGRKYCSKHCANTVQMRAKYEGRKKIVKCLWCDKEVECMVSRIRKFCSYKCANTHRSLYFKQSEVAKEKMSLARKGKIFGDMIGTWRGGVSRAYKTGYYSIEYVNWRNEVFKRDDYTCIECGARSSNGKKVYLESHHIKSFAFNKKLRFEIDNGLTLCKECHKKTDNYGFKAKLELVRGVL